MRYSLCAIALLTAAQVASAQAMFNPNPTMGAPYSRPALSPYLNMLRGGDPAANLYLGVFAEYDRRYRESRIGMPPDYASPNQFYDPTVDDRAELDVKDRTLPPTGHQAGFLIYNAYFRIPNQRAYIPYNPGYGNQGMQGSNRPIR
jgi:hypothetical protein